MPARANAFALATTRSSRVLQPDRETTSRHGTSHAHDALCNTPRTLIFFAAGLPTGRIAELNRQDMAAIFTGSVLSPPHRSRNTHSTLTSLPHRTARMRSSCNMGRNGSLPLFSLSLPSVLPRIGIAFVSVFTVQGRSPTIALSDILHRFSITPLSTISQGRRWGRVDN